MNAVTTALLAAMLAFLDDGAVLAQERRHHYSGKTEDYAAYVRPMEKHLAARGLTLPAWDPATDLPESLLVAKPSDSGRPRRVPKKRRSRPFAGRPCAPGELERWHDFVLEDLAGAADTEESSAVPAVWLFHAHLARLRRACRVSAAGRD